MKTFKKEIQIGTLDIAKSIKKKDLIHVKTSKWPLHQSCWYLSSCSKKAAFNIAESGWKVSNINLKSVAMTTSDVLSSLVAGTLDEWNGKLDWALQRTVKKFFQKAIVLCGDDVYADNFEKMKPRVWKKR